MKKMKKLNNKGFSLVELIIVIAIMAVLVGVLAPQFTKYVGQSKTSADGTNADTLRTTAASCLADTTCTYAQTTEQTYTINGSAPTAATADGNLFTLMEAAMGSSNWPSTQSKTTGFTLKITPATGGGYTVDVTY